MAKRINAEKAVFEMQFYLGSVDYNNLRDQQKLYTRVRQSVAKLSAQTGQSEHSVWSAVENEARKRGLVRPIPGKNM